MEKEVLICCENRKINGVASILADNKKMPVVIFSHGYNGSADSFEKYAGYFLEKGIASFRYDFCGGSVHSRSSMATTDMTIFTEKEDLMAVIRTVRNWEWADPKNIFLFGESQGGLVSALTAAEPEVILRGLILLYPALCIADNWNSKFPRDEDIPPEEDFWGMKLGKVFFASLRNVDTFSSISHFHGPVLIMHGDRDAAVPPEYSRHAARVYSHAQIKIFPGEGHGFTEEGTKQVMELSRNTILKWILPEK